MLGDCLGGAAWKRGHQQPSWEGCVCGHRQLAANYHLVPGTAVAATPCGWWDGDMPSPGKGEDGGTRLGVVLVFAVL